MEANVYFSIGDAVAALSLLLIIPQIMKPIYEFRLGIRPIGKKSIYALAAISFASVLIAATISQISLPDSWLISKPLFWEVFGGLGFFACYVLLALAYVRPAYITQRNSDRFARSAARFLAHATPTDHVDFSTEVRENISRLVKIAGSVNFRQAQKSAFYAFTYREQIEDAAYAKTLLDVLADPPFCRSLVERCPWDVAIMLEELSDAADGRGQGDQFVREITRQSIVSDESILNRECDYRGFSRAPVLSHALFENFKLSRSCTPFAGLHYDDFDGTNAKYVKRLNHAALLTLKTLLASKGEHETSNFYNLISHYEGIFSRARGNKEAKRWALTSEIGSGLREIIGVTRSHLQSLQPEERARYYCSDISKTETYSYSHIVSAVAKLTFDFWCAISNDFDGYGDEYWFAALDTTNEAFPPFGDQPVGMDPLQQHLALLVIDKVRDNMRGYYPAITRFCLWMLGPYERKGTGSTNSAANHLRSEFYRELTSLPELAAAKPDKVGSYLPKNVVYNHEACSLIHTYNGGSTVTTKLNELAIAEVPFTVENVMPPSAQTLQLATSDRMTSEQKSL